MNKVIALIAIAVVLGGGWYLLKDREEAIPVADLVSTTTLQMDIPAQEPDTLANVKEFTITSKGLSYDPKQIEVNKGDTVRIIYVNTVGFHDLVIDEFNVATNQIPAGQREIITFIADKTGTFEYYCSVGTHREQGMWGTLTVK